MLSFVGGRDRSPPCRFSLLSMSWLRAMFALRLLTMDGVVLALLSELEDGDIGFILFRFAMDISEAFLCFLLGTSSSLVSIPEAEML